YPEKSAGAARRDSRVATAKKWSRERCARGSSHWGYHCRTAAGADQEAPAHSRYTPESLYLLLTSESGRRMLATTRTLIMDEIHAVVDDRRGAHLALSVERLATLVKSASGGPLQRIGLSATQKPIEEVARFLVGAHAVD